MNKPRFIVRLDAEHRVAELEIVAPHGSPRVDGLEFALRQLGIRCLHTIEFPTPKSRIMRLKLVEQNCMDFDASRVMQIICTAQNPSSAYSLRRSSHAA